LCEENEQILFESQLSSSWGEEQLKRAEFRIRTQEMINTKFASNERLTEAEYGDMIKLIENKN